VGRRPRFCVGSSVGWMPLVGVLVRRVSECGRASAPAALACVVALVAAACCRLIACVGLGGWFAWLAGLSVAL